MIALGIDPGTAICGFGFVENLRGELRPINYGVITTSPHALMQDRLLKIHSELDALISNFKPNAIAVEKLFFGKNSTTAITIAQIRGVGIARTFYMSSVVSVFETSLTSTPVHVHSSSVKSLSRQPVGWIIVDMPPIKLGIMLFFMLGFMSGINAVFSTSNDIERFVVSLPRCKVKFQLHAFVVLVLSAIIIPP